MGTPVLAALARAATTTTAASSTSTSNPSTASRPPIYHIIGIVLAIDSGLFIGVSFVIKKIGLLKANSKYHEEAGEGYGYLKNAWWWLGMTIMILGELQNFAAYAFVDAILVTPMGSISVVVTAVLSSIFLKERLSFVGKIGCFNCIIGSVVIAVNAPHTSAVATIQEMQHFVISPGFLSYAGVIIVGCVIIAFWAGPRYGKKSMLVYLSVCSLIGGLSVVATQGLGAAIVAQIGGTPQFNQWFLYVLLVFVIITLLTEIVFLNKALNIFNAALVTPTYYVYFTSSTIVTSAILFQGFKGTTLQIITIVMGFLQICSGVVLLQLSKSAKDVPDTAVFKGDLDQVRTIGEQEQPQSEPGPDAIRGGAALLRSISKGRLRKEAEEAKRLKAEHMEPIAENEQIEFDGLRRRKTVLQAGQSPMRRQKTIHPPLGMTHFPDQDSDNESHNPEFDVGILPNFRRRAQTVLGRRNEGPGTMSSSSDSKGHSSLAHGVALSAMPPSNSAASGYVGLGTDGTGDLSEQNFHDNLKRGESIGLSHLKQEDTSYKSPGVYGSTVSWAPSMSPRLTAPATAATPGPNPPPHLQSPGKRQFSFHHVFGGSQRSQRSAISPERPNTAATTSSSTSFSRRVFSGFGKHQQKTEEETLGLVKGDSVAQRDSSPDKGKQAMDEDEIDEEYDDGAFSESPDRISSSESGYGRVTMRRRHDDDDDRPARGAAFV